MTLRGLLWIALAAPALVWRADETPAADALPPEPLHPAVVLLDARAEPVVQSHNPVSTMRTCAACHDTQYIEGHSYHASLDMDQRSAVGAIPGPKPWDYTFGGAGRWNPLTYRYLTPPGDRQLDLGVADWIRHFGWRHVGGGIAERGFAQGPLPNQEQAAGAGTPVDSDNQILDAETGLPRGWGRPSLADSSWVSASLAADTAPVRRSYRHRPGRSTGCCSCSVSPSACWYLR